MSFSVLGKEVMVEGINHLSSVDSKIKHLLNSFDVPDLKVEKNYFWSLCRAIIYQQISGKAAKTIADRFLALFSSNINIKPLEVLSMDINKLYGVGLSRQKAGYIKNIAEAFEKKIIDDKIIIKYNNDDIIEMLTQIKGVGRWTAEMFLIFTLRRSDVFPVTDLGVQKGFQILYSLDELPTVDNMNKKSKYWRPYRSIMALYLWYVVEGPFEW
tara:strand:- start:2372 stop:3010 length:639 start_codon:yes stop_codon:yes gene_type:complete